MDENQIRIEVGEQINYIEEWQNSKFKEINALLAVNDRLLDAGSGTGGNLGVDLGVYKITAYTAGYESTGKTPEHPAYGITHPAQKVKEGHHDCGRLGCITR